MNKKIGHSVHGDLPKPILPGREDLVELYYKAWDLAKEHVGHDDRLPSPYFMDEGFCEEFLWVWDTCFMTMFCRYAPEIYPGIESLDNFYAIQKENGYITMTMRIEDGEDAYPTPEGRINPPLFSWVELDYYKVTGDDSRFKRVLPHLVKLDKWIEKNRRRDDGSYWFNDCGSSGMDNSPRTCRLDDHGNNTNFIDLASQQTLAAKSIAEIARIAGDKEVSEEYSKLYAERVEYVNKELWCERHKFYYDAYLDKHFTGCKTTASFWPMIAELADDNQTAGLVEHLINPNEFNRPHPVPTLSYDNPNYDEDGGYWLGGVWAPNNYMVVKGLEKYGYDKLAKEIVLKHLSFMHKTLKDFGPNTIWECYSPEHAKPATDEKGHLARQNFVGWSGLGPISMLIENVIGIRVDYPARKITWISDELDEHGVENLQFGPHKVSLKALARTSVDEMPELEIIADCKIDVEFKPPTK